MMIIKTNFTAVDSTFLARGFTLLEVAIVLAIIGLITGGVLIGTNLIRAAELRQIRGGSEMYIVAARQFSGQYNALPGDMDNATSIWGAKAGGTADGLVAACYTYFDTSQTPTSATCNGNGNNRIQHNAASGNDFFELWQTWQHLSNAGMIDGIYTGQGKGNTGFDNRVAVPGLNAPEGSVAGGVFTLRWWGTAVSVAQLFDGEYGNTLMIGRTSDADDPFLSAADMATIDDKSDDGKPGTGTIRAYKNSYRPNCATSNDPNGATYDVDNEENGCTMVLITGF